MFTIIHGDGTDGTMVGAGTTGVGPDTTDTADGMTLTGDQAGDGTTGVGRDITDTADGTGLITAIIIAPITITITGIADITTVLIAEEDITGMPLRLPGTGHTPGITMTIEEIRILPITEGVQTQLITGEVQIPPTAEEATTIVIILPGETAVTQIMATAEESIQILRAPAGITIVEPADAQTVMPLKVQGLTHHVPLVVQGLQAEA